MDERDFYDVVVAEGLHGWLEMNGYAWNAETRKWSAPEGGEPDWDAIYDEVWAEDSVTGNGPYGYPYEDDGALFSAVRHIDFERFRDIVEDFGIDVREELRRFASWREVAQWADCLMRLNALVHAIWAMKESA